MKLFHLYLSVIYNKFVCFVNSVFLNMMRKRNRTTRSKIMVGTFFRTRIFGVNRVLLLQSITYLLFLGDEQTIPTDAFNILYDYG